MQNSYATEIEAAFRHHTWLQAAAADRRAARARPKNERRCRACLPSPFGARLRALLALRMRLPAPWQMNEMPTA